ncbi:ABC transporter substrate-binding protein [Streptomyces sp. DSM 3412]|uniref:ABC transporter substrate-binding protein n=1 Tax=Streptomyces gottesmaniae TaxID=3075518 RepID=A0ABU2Z105_9ACTN|nr:ABC transporter substrate-binding protein [Streptomyces sp. DSM 3412]MDT0570262.1 ABC transporter substrate-binding protein [Streptomyces sp. DSM 3412]
MRRRVLYSICTATGLGLVLAACGGGTTAGGSGSGSVTFVSWGGAFQDAQQKAWTDPFTKKTGAEVVQDGPTDYSKLKAMVQAGNVSWDVMDVDANVAIKECGTLFQKIDTKTVDTSKIDPKLDIGECGVPVVQQSIVMVYDKKKFADNPPTSMADFFDLKKYPGKRGVYNTAAPGLLEQALLADGVAADQLYPLDVDRALKKLDSIRGSISWYAQPTQSTEQLNSGSVSMALVYNGRAHAAVKDGADYAPVWSTAFRTTDALVIPKGAPNKGAAEKLLSYIATPEAQAALTESIPYAPTTVNTSPKVDALTEEFLPTSAKALPQTHVIDMNWWANNNDDALQAWTKWQTG